MKKIFIISLLCVAANSYSQLSGEDILKRSAATLKQLKSVSYNMYAEQQGEKISADVTINRVKPFPVYDVSQLKLSGLSMTENGSKQVSFAFDGNKFEFTDPSTNQVVRLDSPTISKISRTGMMTYGMLPMPCYWQTDPFAGILNAMTSAEHVSDTSIYGTNCYKLKVTTESKDARGPAVIEVYWFIGKDDFLVRGMHSKYLKQLLKIRSTNQEYKNEFFTLSSSAGEIKTITGREPITDGMLALGTPAPDWTLPSSLAKSIQLAKLKGKVVLLDFWGTWCVPCIKAMPDMQAIADHFKGKPVEVIGVSVEMDKTADPVGFAKGKGYTYPIVLNGNTITAQYKVRVFPSIYIVDKQGKIIHAEHSGGRENFKEDLIQRISKALGE